MHKLTSYFAPTHRDDPAEAEFPSHKLLVRAGFIRAVGSGIYSLLPLGMRVIKKIENILREEMNAVDGQEVYLPVTQPAELWKESGRWDTIGSEMLRFKDHNQREMCLAMTHEESIVHLVRGDVKSWRQLPLMLYQVQTKFRDEQRPRGGLIRTREFTMKDAYSFHESEDDLDAYYMRMHAAYMKIFSRCELDFVSVESDPGMMGGGAAHEFIAFSPFGEDTVITCPQCNYAANRQVARFQRTRSDEAPLPIEEVATPGKTTIEDVAAFLGVEKSQTAKAVFFHGQNRGLIFAILRGDYEINETLLAKAAGETELRPALPEEIARTGAVAGYASPIGVKNAFVIADTSIEMGRNFISGANREGFHLKNVTMPRDFKPDCVAEIAAAEDGHACITCGSPLTARRGIEIGNIFKLGTRYSASMNAVFADRNGVDLPFVMGCYGIGSGRLMASIVEQRHDKDGIIWPAAVAPFTCEVVIANDKAEASLPEILLQIADAKMDAIFDDRDLRAGVKFKDADLVGCPIRITLGRKIEAGIVEIRDRKSGEVSEHSIACLAEALRSGSSGRKASA